MMEEMESQRHQDTKQPKPSLVSSWLGGEKKLPPGWRWVKLGEVCEFIRGVSFDKAQVTASPEDGRVPILRAGNIGRRLDTTNDLIWVPKTCVSQEQLLRIGDVVICMSSGSSDVVGKTAPVDQMWYGSVGAFCGIVRAKNHDMARFFGLWFQSHLFLDWRNEQARGANIQNLRFSQLAKLTIPLPPLPEQQRIAAILREQMAATEKARKAAQERLAAIKALPAAFLRQVFPQPGQPLPPGWRWVKLGEVCEEERQIIEGRSCDAEALPYLSLEHIESNTGRILRQPYGSIEDEGVSTTFRFTPCHVLYGKLRPYLNKVALPEFEGRCTTEIIPLRHNPNITREFLALILRRRETVEYAMQGKTGSRMPRADMGHLFALQIPLPPPPEQQRIVAILREQMAAVEKARKAAQEELETISALPAALLRRAFAGEL